MFGQDMTWVSNLKVGDTVVVRGYDIGKQSYRTVTVQKVTPQQVHVGDTPERVTKFWKKDGSEVGKTSSWHSIDLVEATPKLLEEIKATRLRDGLLYKLRKVDWSKVSTETLQAVFVLVQDKANG